MAPDREERNRVLGVPVGGSWPGWVGDEQQRVMGFPADWFRFRRRGKGSRKARAGKSGDSRPDNSAASR